MNQADIEQTMEALEVCSSLEPDKCDHCPIAWMWDHGYDCQPRLAACALDIIKELQNAEKH